MAKVTIDDCAAARSPGRVIRRIDKLMWAWVESHMPASEITFSQWIALKAVRDGVATNPGALARELGHTTGAVTRLIDSLEQRGLIARDRDSTDRRVVSLSLTEEGRATLLKFAAVVVDSWNEVLEEFSQDEFEHMIADLNRLLAAIERCTGEAHIEEIAA